MRAEVLRSEVESFLTGCLEIGEEALADITSVRIDGRVITVEQRRRGDDGQLVAAGDFIATVTTEIGLREGR